MKIALYKHQYGTNVFDSIFDGIDGYVRVSEHVDIDFKMLPPSETVEAELAALDKAESKLREQFTLKLDEIKTARANLRALTFEATP